MNGQMVKWFSLVSLVHAEVQFSYFTLHCTYRQHTRHLTKRHSVRAYGYGGFPDSVGMGILWGFPQAFCGYGMGMGIEIQSPR